MKDITEIRSEIDKIDDQLSSLFVQRLNLVKEVAEFKKNNSKAVNDTSREDKILYRLAKDKPEEYKYYLKELYQTIFATSKSYQSKLICSSSKSIEMINKAIESQKSFPITATVACQGVEGSNSSVACKSVFPISDITYFKSFEGVFNAVEKGFCEFGVLPIENSTAGSVLEVYDLMNKYSFYIASSVRVKVNHCLVGVKGATKQDVKKIISHSQALSQCSSYLKNLGVQSESVENTAVSAQMVSQANDKSLACLCRKECAEIYNLEILEENVQDNASNYTRFIVISKELQVYEGSNKISIITSAPHETGSLSKILARFSALGLSLTKLESRPIVGSDFEFLFYFDFEGSVKDKSCVNLISELENTSQHFVFLGCYKEIVWNIV